jgi:aspartate aminotransferase-like enzyme
VKDLIAEPGRPIAADAVAAALGAGGFDVVALVHAESASGILNPIEEIAALASSASALLVVDAVASFGGHRLDVDALGADIVVVGPQKSLGGSAGVSALAVSQRAWQRIEAPGAGNQSILSLLDLKHNWLDSGRGALPGMPSAIEFYALQATLDRIEAEGVPATIGRHEKAAAASRAGVIALGLAPWAAAAEASNLVTGVQLPDGIDRAAALAALGPFETGIAAAIGPGTERLLRLNHTGPRARFDIVLADVVALGAALSALGAATNPGAGAAAVAAIYGGRV